MSTMDSIPNILPPYEQTFGLWGKQGKTFAEGDEVPAVGLAKTYAVRLASVSEAPDRFLWVQENKITALMAHQPMTDVSVFDGKGQYLGRGGQLLEAFPSRVQRTAERQPPTPPALVQNTPPKPPATIAMVEHTFPLREGLLIKIALPQDLSAREAERLSKFLELLPF